MMIPSNEFDWLGDHALMTSESLLPVLTGVILVLVTAYLAIGPIRQFVESREAAHELRQGSVSYIMRVGLWLKLTLLLMALWFAGTVVGDWYVSGDFFAALARSMHRFEILLRIAVELQD